MIEPFRYRILCFIVFVVQFGIAFLSYLIAYKRDVIDRKYIDILVGASWTITATWWLFCFVTLTGL